MGKKRSKGQTATALSLPESLKDAIDARAAQLGLSRSAYLCALARADIAVGGPLTIEAHPDQGSVSSARRPTDLPKDIADTALRQVVSSVRRSWRKAPPE